MPEGVDGSSYFDENHQNLSGGQHSLYSLGHHFSESFAHNVHVEQVSRRPGNHYFFFIFIFFKIYLFFKQTVGGFPTRWPYPDPRRTRINFPFLPRTAL